MSKELQELINQLDPPQRSAIELVRLSLNCFNSVDGCGLFSGVTRYNVLADRIRICAVQAENLTRFWSLLLTKMLWPIPPKKADELIVKAINQPDGNSILRVLATETPSIITLARMLHDQDKADRKNPIQQDDEPTDFPEECGQLQEGLFK